MAGVDWIDVMTHARDMRPQWPILEQGSKMSDLVIKDFDRKLGNAGIWVAGAMLFVGVTFPFYQALHFAVAPASELLTGFAKDHGVSELSMFQRMSSFAFLLPGTLLFCLSLVVSAVIFGSLGLYQQGKDIGEFGSALLRWMPATLVIAFSFLAMVCTLTMPMVDIVQTWGMSLTEEIGIFDRLPVAFLMMAGGIVAAVVIHRLEHQEANRESGVSA